ncbi:HAAS signaling domain-containing protein [Clostridium thermarum]|uniref:HAAS signaling domain-containing protein n=1 Tax=Clostridium thermarum TaxID=1716543 RepID=UPI0013D607A5|nr:hypothetical protein [Clostridium thermarum]
MDLIERYLYAVTSRLPEDTREDVKRELQANIEDMLPDDPSEADVRKVLERLGNPTRLADEYRQVKRYLVGPGLYDKYISVLKLVVMITCVVFSIFALLEEVVKTPVDSSIISMTVGIIVSVIVAIVEGVFQGAFWVTLTFAIMERTGADAGTNPFNKKEWSINDLPPLPEKMKRTISRGETIFSMICTVFFTALLYLNPELIGVYTGGSRGLTLAAPLLVTEVLRKYIFVILVLAAVQFVILIYKFIMPHWNRPLAIASAAHNAAVCILVLAMVSNKSLISPDFISWLANITKTSISKISDDIVKFSWGFAVIFIAISVGETIMAFVRSGKKA